MFQLKLVVLAVVSVVLSFVGSVAAQVIEPPEVEWERTFVGRGYAHGISIFPTEDNGFMVIGNTDEKVGSLYPGILIIKIDQFGNSQWQKTPIPNTQVYATSSNQTNDKGYIIIGTANENNGPPLKTSVYVCKTNPLGEIEWVNFFFDDNYDMNQQNIGRSVQQTSDNGFIIAGGSIASSGIQSDIFLIKTSLFGDLEWKKHITGGKNYSQGNYILANNSNYLIAGYGKFQESGNICGYLCKTNLLGEVFWDASLCGLNPIVINSAIQIPNNQFIVAGDSWPWMYIAQVNEDGVPVWEKIYPVFYARELRQASDGGFIIIGGTDGNSPRVYLLKTNSDGEKQWDKFPTDKYSGGQSILETNDRGYILTGVVNSTEGYALLYLVKLSYATLKDCNKNGISDATDISSGTSKDCNANKIPDECDIASKASQDFNGNGIPDECENTNQPPQITHTPITSAKKGDEIWFSMEVTDDKSQLETLVVYAKVTGEESYTPYPIGVDPQKTQYELGVPGLTQTLAGVDYYIEATDTEGATKTTPVYHIKVIDKYPVIIIPGAMGTELWDMEKNEKIWIDTAGATDPLHPNDPFLLRLLLQNNGLSPDTNKRCEYAIDLKCTSGVGCPLFSCADGGSNQITAKNIVKVSGIFTGYKQLVEFLETHGYIFGKDLFLVGYDWRLSLGYYQSLGRSPLPEDLRNAINNITPKCQNKVCIIAHSLGGLLLRSYLKWCQDNGFDHYIDTTIYLGTPHKGAPKAYGVLEWAHAFLFSFPVYGLERHTISFIAQNFPSVYQLLPRYNFIEGQGGKLENFEESFLNLSSQALVTMAREFHESIKDFNPIERSFAINGSGQSTPFQYKVLRGECIDVIPDPTGDGTVPRYSSSTFGETKTFFVNGNHDNLPGIPRVQEKILKILERKENDSVEGVQDTPFAKGLFVGLTCSPITLHISDSEGNTTEQDEVGDIQEGIPDSQFFVFDHNEAVFLPEDKDYIVDIKAKKTGTFTLIFKTIDSEGNIVDQIEYRDIPTSKNGNSEVILTPENHMPELILDVDGDGTSDFSILPGENPPEELKNMLVENGDVNKDKNLDISDAVAILGYLFLGSKIACIDACDTNSDSEADVSDPIYLLGYLFLGTAEKPKGLIFCP